MLQLVAKLHLSDVEPEADDSIRGLGISLSPLQVVRVVVPFLDPDRVGRVEVELGIVGFCCGGKVGDEQKQASPTRACIQLAGVEGDTLTRDIKRARGGSDAVADSALVGAVVCGFQLELQLWCFLQVWHRHTDELAIPEPADVS